MNLRSILNPLKSLPPSGQGIYARGQGLATLARFAVVALHADRADTLTKAPELKRRGVKVWLYTTPEGWYPDVWQASLARLSDLATRLGVDGAIADPESRWPNAPDSAAVELGRALADSPVRWGVTSYSLWPRRRALAAGCNGDVWASPQIYQDASPGTGGVNTDQLRGFYREWADLFGPGRIIPSIAGYSLTSGELNREPPYRAYLGAMPDAVGYLAWTVDGTAEWRLRALLEHAPASLPMRVLLEARAYATTPIGIAAIVAFVAIVGLIVVTRFV